MGLKDNIQNKVAGHLFSPKRRNARREKAERRRKRSNAPHLVEYYHDVSDPYSHLMVQVLPVFAERYDVELEVHLVGPPPDWAAPDRERLYINSRRDAERLAQRAGLEFKDPGAQPDDATLAGANAALLDLVKAGTFLEQASQLSDKVWRDEILAQSKSTNSEVQSALAEADERRAALGHYLGGVLYYAGEWYWGVDRLHYLEQRLRELGAARAPDAPFIFAPPVVPNGGGTAAGGKRPELHWYLSFRSPYTGIVADRVKALADAYDAEIKLRFVLPMVMRGMQVPRMKGFYIMSDTVREAERMGIPFGNMFDPVGEPVERGYAILHKAIELGRGLEFARSFLSGVWSEGINARTDKGLEKLTERAGLSWAELKPMIGTDHWRADAEANRQEMLSYGIWGVPSFRVGDVAAWGQDRLWVIEDALRGAAQTK